MLRDTHELVEHLSPVAGERRLKSPLRRRIDGIGRIKFDLRPHVVRALLEQHVEQARVEEFRDTPSLTVVDPPRAPYKKVRPQRSLLVAGAGLLGLILGLGIALLRQSVTALNQEELTAWAAARSAAEEIPIVRALKRRQSPGG